jgi:plasmid stability protein
MMASVLVRNLSEETHRALKQRAAKSGKSTQAEIRIILDEAVRKEPEVGFGTQLKNIALKYGVSFDDYDRDSRPTEPAVFE